jgi:hypothetical protein
MIQQVLNEGRLIRDQWSTIKDGKQLLCLYTAMVNDPNARPDTCPESICPQWFARLLPWIDDRGSKKRWRQVTQRVAELEPKLSSLHPLTEERIRQRILAIGEKYIAREETYKTLVKQASISLLGVIECVCSLTHYIAELYEVPDEIIDAILDEASR